MGTKILRDLVDDVSLERPFGVETAHIDEQAGLFVRDHFGDGEVIRGDYERMVRESQLMAVSENEAAPSGSKGKR